MKEVTAPASDVEGELAATTQLMPTLPPPFTRQRFTEEVMTKRTAEAEKSVRGRWEQLRKGGEYDPPSVQGTVLYPGMDGGGEWGGVAFDPKSGLLYVNANEMAWIVKLAERKMPDGDPTDGKTLYERNCAACHRSNLRGTPPEFPSLVGIGTRRNIDEISAIVREGGGRMPGYASLHGAARRAIVQYIVTGTSIQVRADAPTPFDLKYSLDGDARFSDPDGFPAITPPWGHADGDRHEQGGHRVAGAARRDARLGADQYRQRELRRAGRRPPADWSSSAPRCTTRNSTPSTRARARCSGKPNSPPPAMRRRRSTK